MYDLEVFNERGNTILASDEPPYRFITGMRQMEFRQAYPHAPNTGMFRTPVSGVTDKTLLCVDLPQERFCAWQIRYDEAISQYIVADEALNLLSRDTPSFSFCLADTTFSPPSSESYGIEVFSDSGDVILDSSSPLLQIIDSGEIELVYDRLNPNKETYLGTSPGLLSVDYMTHGFSSGSQDQWVGYGVQIVRRGNSYFARQWYDTDPHGIYPGAPAWEAQIRYIFTNRPR